MYLFDMFKRKPVSKGNAIQTIMDSLTLQSNHMSKIEEENSKLKRKVEKLKNKNKRLKSETKGSINLTDLQVILKELKCCSNCGNNSSSALNCSNCTNDYSDWVSTNTVVNEILNNTKL